MLVDSWYDPYLGVMALMRVKDGVLRKGMKVRMMDTGASHQVDRVGVLTPKIVDVLELGPGEVGLSPRRSKPSLTANRRYRHR